MLWPMLLVAGLLLRTRWPFCRYLACTGLGFMGGFQRRKPARANGSTLSRVPEVTAVVQISSVADGPAVGKQTLMRIERVDGHWPGCAGVYRHGLRRTRLCAGQRWQLKLRMRPVHGKLNEGRLRRPALERSHSAGPLTAQVRQARLLEEGCGLRQLHYQPIR
ncbi:hypothetical protein M8494_16395 [Serratia ureilytica]